MTLATTLDPPLDHSLHKRQWPSPRLLAWSAACVTLCASLSIAGYFAIQWRNTPPEAIVPINWPEAAAPAAPSSQPELAPRKGRGLRPAPDPRLVEALPLGLLPKIGEDGTRPADRYARPPTPVSGAMVDAPRLAILITGGGIGHLATVEAMVKLPPDVSIALSPYSSDIDRQAADIRSEGHEIFLEMPVGKDGEPFGGAGPNELGDRFDADINQTRLRWAMSRFAGYVGVSGHFSDRVKPDGNAMAALSELGQRGLLLFDVGGDSGPSQLDTDLQSRAMDLQLQRLEEIARQKGQAIGLAGTTPLAIDRLKNWSAGLAARGFRLVPVSTLLH